ncbi:HAMP domain-containing sensor histidine kinase [Rhodanobacter sp. KK11]|uniref:sensor histidine kinase n=1 Tax=Rhodanobacter sp. KK11 TaxID=3083255 RepID=UPI0029665D9A|nr:HAMP domain-containing sensor histidine kinase [Rhodanobacter sp. KK11]MDW2982596.1 HAMP domain-containing sensor histidine kinase [Rhodanobacter sp. KK11]
MSSTAPLNAQRAGTATVRHELTFLNVFRLVQALVYAGLAFSPPGLGWPALAIPDFARAVTTLYLVFALVALLFNRRSMPYARTMVAATLAVDITAAVLAIIAMHDARIGIAMMLAVNLSAGALILPLRLSSFFAALATLGMLGHTLFGASAGSTGDRGLLEAALFGLAYFATTTLCHVLGRQLRATEALAEQRSTDLANLAQVNELIIRRMKTGVLLVDDANRIHQINESAWMLLGNPGADQRDLGQLAPELSRRLYHWMTSGKLDETATQLADGVPEVVPRFTRLAPNDDSHVLIFLDDTSLLSRRAEELTLTSLGRLSASIAHEIRNPLAAIRYSAQLLAESRSMDATDQRMVEIINNHCIRLNEIIENILQLSRRERSRPETLDLGHWAQAFVEEYRQGNDLGADSLRAIAGSGAPVAAVADPQQLQQVVWNLVQNALRYGRLPGEPARVMVVTRQGEHGVPILEVIDRGPGIAPKVAAQIFEPFYTTHEYGTGLGLYLARQMSDANQASLEYVRVAGGGSCFRLVLTPPARGPADAAETTEAATR